MRSSILDTARALYVDACRQQMVHAAGGRGGRGARTRKIASQYPTVDAAKRKELERHEKL